MEFWYEDCKSLLEQVNLQEKELRNKRRWLIGLPTSGNEAGKLKESKSQPERPIPEYLLREDDVFYETIRSFVKKLVEEPESKNKYQILHDDMQLIHSPTDITTLLFLIDDMTNQGLFQFAKLLTSGSIEFEKTRWKMKQIIKQHLLENNTPKIKLSNDHLSLLKNPQNFRWNHEFRFIPNSGSSHSAVYKILSILEDLPLQTLSAMHRKLRGVKDYIPKLIPKRSGWNRDVLIKRLREKCLRFLSKLNEGDSLQEPLAKAMEVAGLTLKLIQGYHYATNFIQFSPEIISLQNEIAMCIKLVDHIELKLLKKIQIIIDPDVKLSDSPLRVKNLLMEYLLECSDIENIPRSLFKVLAIIKKSPKGKKKRMVEMKVDEEVECILNVSASMKQVLWDVIPEDDFDLKFADVYMEDHGESDGDDICEDNEQHMENNVSNFSDFNEEVGSTEEIEIKLANSDSMAGISLMESDSLNSLKVTNSMPYHLVSFGNMETNRVCDKDLSLERNLVFDDDRGICGNRYLGVQVASDEVSMVAYCVIGRMLGDFARIEGCELNSSDLCYLESGSNDLNKKFGKAARKEKTTHEEDDCSIMIKVVEELIPSFPKSEADRLKQLMGCK
ncbi:hypothetical protein Lser_V15G23152 [Lactuca serriola]